MTLLLNALVVVGAIILSCVLIMIFKSARRAEPQPEIDLELGELRNMMSQKLLLAADDGRQKTIVANNMKGQSEPGEGKPAVDEDHAVKACAAAPGPLNYEITECGLQKVPIGVNIGEVRSGTFGRDLFKIADNEEDGEDPSNQDLEQMYSSDWNKEIPGHQAEDPNQLQFGTMPSEGSSASDPSDDVPKFPEVPETWSKGFAGTGQDGKGGEANIKDLECAADSAQLEAETQSQETAAKADFDKELTDSKKEKACKKTKKSSKEEKEARLKEKIRDCFGHKDKIALMMEEEFNKLPRTLKELTAAQRSHEEPEPPISSPNGEDVGPVEEDVRARKQKALSPYLPAIIEDEVLRNPELLWPLQLDMDDEPKRNSRRSSGDTVKVQFLVSIPKSHRERPEKGKLLRRLSRWKLKPLMFPGEEDLKAVLYQSNLRWSVDEKSCDWRWQHFLRCQKKKGQKKKEAD